MSRTTSQRLTAPVTSTAAAPAGLQPVAALSTDSAIAADVKALVVAGRRDAARERFALLVTNLQRRAGRIAYQYLRDVQDADEAVQDAFVKVFTHITSYREDLPFEMWFTRILVNRCLDLQKARARRIRWTVPMPAGVDGVSYEPAAPQPSPEQRLLGSERGRLIVAAVQQLPDRQRTVFTLCQIGEQTTSEVSQALGLSEATVRVHLFRAIRKLRALLVHER